MLEILKEHLKHYPKMDSMDIIKLCFQNEFGCEHLVKMETTLNILKEECQELPKQPLRIEYIGSNLARLYLGQLNDLEAYTINQLFVSTANTVKGNKDSFIRKLKVCQEYINTTKFDNDVKEYLKNGIKAISHSTSYHQHYQPHYRVIRLDLLNYFNVFININKQLLNKSSLMIAIDGKCGSGKTTLASLLNEVYMSHLFHMDDFFLQPYQRTQERLNKPGENVDHERFLKEVLIPLKQQNIVHYQKFDCGKMKLNECIESIPYIPLNIIEGTYSLHPNLIHYYDLKITLTLTDDIQMERIIKRNGNLVAEKFRDIWIPLENKYFNELNIFDKADLLIDMSKAHKEITL